MFINNHKVKIIQTANKATTIIKIDDGAADLQQIDCGQGRLVLTGYAWSESQKKTIEEVFPNLNFIIECTGSSQRYWFHSDLGG